MSWEVLQGDCRELMKSLPAGSVDLVVTSPPYAMQRKDQYGGISEAEYPEWTAAWMESLRGSLSPLASVLINIREHVVDGELSDYVHRTRMLLRASGWTECDELIWNKPDAAPLGDPNRPRRSWERVLWFAPTSRPFVDCRGNGTKSNRIGWERMEVDWISSGQTPIVSGIARHTDVCTEPVCKDTFGHPATYPIGLPKWLVKGWSKIGGTIIDPFTGSGTTGVAAVQTGRNFIGFELDPKYCEIARRRISEAVPLWAPEPVKVAKLPELFA